MVAVGGLVYAAPGLVSACLPVFKCLPPCASVTVYGGPSPYGCTCGPISDVSLSTPESEWPCVSVWVPMYTSGPPTEPSEKEKIVRPIWNGNQHRINTKTITPGQGEKREREYRSWTVISLNVMYVYNWILYHWKACLFFRFCLRKLDQSMEMTWRTLC